ncbi:MAG: acetate/propionate family kinase [bacterium]
MKYLIVNTGSVSAKYAIYSEKSELFFGHFEIEADKIIVTFYNNGEKDKSRIININEEIFKNSLNFFIEEAIKNNIIENKNDISCLGVRIVSPGTYFQTDRIINEDFISKIIEKKEEAPRHIPNTLKEIEKIKKIFNQIPIIGISDSAFHKNVPDFVKYYAIPKKVAEDLDIYHFGYHGISTRSIINKLSVKNKYINNLSSKKIIICHLGGGISVVAVKNGKSFDTSMGYTPLQGLIMSTRVGDIDPIAVMFLGQKLNKNITELEAYFNNECGLLGLSGKSSDIRDLIELEKKGDEFAKLALEKFIMSIKKYIGSYIAEMGGVDAIIFSGTIGERSFIMRERICEGLEFLGIKLNKKINNETIGFDKKINTIFSPVEILVICTDEMKDMADKVIKFIK